MMIPPGGYPPWAGKLFAAAAIAGLLLGIGISIAIEMGLL
jgi:uncharacterized membrane-anchored protein YitT (DUF2179 family)